MRTVSHRIAVVLLPLLCAAGEWSTPISVVGSHGRLAIGDRLHVVGHTGSNLVHRASGDGGATWGAPTVIAPAAGNYPMMYGGFACQGRTLYLLTADGDMGSGPRQLDVRRSLDDGATWSSPVRITGAGGSIFRAQIVASGQFVHVGGQGDPTQGSSWYFRSVDGGATWGPDRKRAVGGGPDGGGQDLGGRGSIVHIAYTKVLTGVGGGDTYHRRSLDNGLTWSAPVVIGENSAQSRRQARVQVEAAGGNVLVSWQREANVTGDPVPSDRLGYNTSADGGVTWGTPRILPGDTGIDRNHQATCMTAGGATHIIWRHGDTAADPTGYMFSPDYGETWRPREIAIDTDELNHPYAVVADAQAVHALAGPLGAMRFASRRLADDPTGTPPTISDIANQSVNEDTATGPSPFTIGDAETAAGSLSVTGASSNTALVPNANIVFGGTGADRTVTVTPAANQSGTATITITVSDGSLSANDTFTLTVNAVNDAPTISDIVNQSVNEDTATGALSFTIGDVETAAGSLTVTGSSSNTTLVPTANIVFGGSGANRTVIVTPAANQNGTATITIAVSDGSLNAIDTFVLTIGSVNDVPTISAVPDRTVATGASTGAMSFTIGDAETAASALTVTRTSSNTTLLPLANVALGGSGASRTVTAIPAAGQTGSSTVTITVSDGSLSAVEVFVLTVTPTDTTPPVLSTPTVEVRGTVSAGTVSVTVDGAPATITDRSFTAVVPATAGTVTVVAIDGAGRTTTRRFAVAAIINFDG